MTRVNWMKRSHDDLHNQANQTASYLADDANITRMGLTGAQPWITSEFTPKLTALNTAYAVWSNITTRTRLTVANLQAAEDAFILVYRQLYSGFLRENPLVSDADLIAMGLPQHSPGERHPAPVPTTHPVAEVDTSEPGQLTLRFQDENSESRAKPAGVHGAEFVWDFCETPPTDASQLTHSAFDTKTPITLTFNGADRGRTVWFALRWENTRGDKGPWSTLYSAVIP